MIYVIFTTIIALTSQASSVTKDNASILSVCEIAKIGDQLNGKKVRVAARYVTDLRHGAYFTDMRCPQMSIAEGPVVAPPIDGTVQRFNRALREHALSRKLVVFDVVVTGTYTRVGVASLPSDSASTAHGQIIIDKVCSFKRISTDQDN